MNQMPVPPVDMVMPATANTVFIVVSYAAMAIVAVLLALDGVRRKNAIGLFCLIGGAIAFVTEPAWDILACVWYPDKEHSPILRAFNYSIPYWMLPAYALYMGAQGYWMSRQFAAGITAGRLWTLFFVFWVSNALIEVPGINLGLYTYYGDQPFQLFGFPLWMAMTNSLIPITVGAALYGLRNVLTGWRSLLVIPMLPIIIASGEAAFGWPVWLTLNSGLGFVATHAGALVTLGLSVSAVYLIGITACRRPAEVSMNGPQWTGAPSASSRP